MTNDNISIAKAKASHYEKALSELDDYLQPFLTDWLKLQLALERIEPADARAEDYILDKIETHEIRYTIPADEEWDGWEYVTIPQKFAYIPFEFLNDPKPYWDEVQRKQDRDARKAAADKALKKKIRQQEIEGKIAALQSELDNLSSED